MLTWQTLKKLLSITLEKLNKRNNNHALFRTRKLSYSTTKQYFID
jgi:hypothetical protein